MKVYEIIYVYTAASEFKEQLQFSNHEETTCTTLKMCNFPVPRHETDVGHAGSPVPGGGRGDAARCGVVVANGVSEPFRGAHGLEDVLSVDAVL